MAGGEARGFVVLKDRAGVAQYLLMPTAKITGIEDPAVLAPGAANYFAQAWDERGYVERKLGRPLGRAQLSIAVNSIYGRSQDQLHLHIDCLDRSVRAALVAADIPRTGRWTERGIPLKGHAYRARWMGAGELAAANPFQLLAQSMPGARAAMGAWTLALVGAAAPDGAQGFYLLADRADPAAGDPGSAEDLQDHDCRL
jgi:CDP-diacylglycerol pyrophosphatase